MSRRAILLGATGFLGRALTRRLEERGVEVHGFSSQTLDLRSAPAFAALDALVGAETDIVDLAGITPDRGATTIPSFLANVAMSTNLAAFLEQRPVRSCVYLSSDAVYGDLETAVTETSPLERWDERLPRTNLYVASKLASERVLASAADRTGMPLLVIRPCAIFGEGDTHGAYGPNLFARTIRQEGKVRLFGNGEELRDHLHVDDFAEVLARLLEGPPRCGVLNVATGDARSFASVVDVLRSLAPPFSVEHVPRAVPIRHRSYDVTNLLRAVPGLRFGAFEDRLRQTLESG